MAQANDLKLGDKLKPLVISRSFAAPRALVFRAWSTAEHMKRWFSPEGVEVPEAEIDFRPGGAFVVCMRLPDGTEHWCRGAFGEVVPVERLTFNCEVSTGGKTGFLVRTLVLFAVEGAGTRMTVEQSYEIYDQAFRFAVEGSAEGWRTTLDKLGREVARIRSSEPAVHAPFSIERLYDATPAQVFHALTDPAAKARWFVGGEGFSVIEREMDVRPGGRERLKGRWTNGMVSTFDAVYFDVVANRRLVYAYEMHLDDSKISVSLATVELQPVEAGVRLVVTEQGAFLNGYEDAGSREHGTGLLLDRLGASLKG